MAADKPSFGDISRQFAATGVRLERDVRTALESDVPVEWRPTNTAGRIFDSVLRLNKMSKREVIEQALAAAREKPDADGLRLMAPIGPLRPAAAVRRILAQPGYQAASKVPGDQAGVKSFVIVPPGKGPATAATDSVLSWPLNLMVTEEVRRLIADSPAVRDGSVRIVPMEQGKRAGPAVSAEIVDVPDTGLIGKQLAVSFYGDGRNYRALPSTVDVGRILGGEPRVFLPLEGDDAADKFTGFVNKLSHGKYVDVAAWETMREAMRGKVDLDASPLVIAPQDFLGQARLSQTIAPTLSRLRGTLDRFGDFPVGTIGPGIAALGSDFLSRVRLSDPPTLRQIVDLLQEASTYEWSGDTDIGAGLKAIFQAFGEERREIYLGESFGDGGESAIIAPAAEPSARSAPAPAPELAPAPAPSMAEPVAIPMAPSAAPAAAPPVAGEPPPPSRYTDVKILDSTNALHPMTQPVLAGRSYKLDVAVRVEREGYTKDDAGQGPVVVPDQKSEADIWVYVSDETERYDEDPAAPSAIRFANRFGKLVLPLAGDTPETVQFPFHIPPAMLGQIASPPRIGVRLYHKLDLIDHLEIEVPAVLPGKAADDQAIKVAFKHTHGERPLLQPDPGRAVRRVNISVGKLAASDTWRFTFVFGDDDGRPNFFGDQVLTQELLNSWLANFRNILLDFVFSSGLTSVALGAEESDALLRRLAVLGRDILQVLFGLNAKHDDLAAMYGILSEEIGSASLLQVALSKGAEDFVLPWQILAFATPQKGQPVDPMSLWGYRFAIEVKRCGDGAPPPVPIRAMSAKPLSLVYGRWKQFTNEVAHFAELQEIVKGAGADANIAQPVVDGSAAFLAALRGGGGDLLYVYAHGHSAIPASPAGVALRTTLKEKLEDVKGKLAKNSLLLSPDELKAQDDMLKLFERLAKPDDGQSVLSLSQDDVLLIEMREELAAGAAVLANAPIVILNTCNSAQIWSGFPGSFVEFFIDRGARAVVGTETALPIVLAAAFGGAVMKPLFAGATLGEAVRQARHALLTNHRNPLSLCYSVYGSADARLF